MLYASVMILALSLFILLPGTLHGGARTLLLDEAPSHEISGHLEFYKDPSRKLSFTEILSSKSGHHFQPLSGNLGEGYSRSPVWLRFTVLKTAQFPADVWLRLYPPYLDYLDLYIQHGSDPANPLSYSKIMLGDHVPGDKYKAMSTDFVTPISLPLEKPVTIYVRLQTTSSLTFGGSIHSLEHLTQYTSRTVLFQGAFLGFIIVIGFINLIFFLRVGDRIFLHFTLCNLSLAVYYLARGGTINILLPFHSHLFSDYFIGCWGLTLMFFSLIVINIFNTSGIPWIHRFIIFSSILGGLTFISTPLHLYSEVARISTIAALPLIIILSWLSFNSMVKKNPGGMFFLIAFNLGNLFIFLYFLSQIRLIPAAWWNSNNVEIGTFFNMILMSVALSERLRKAESSAAQLARETEKRAISLAQEMTQELEKNKKMLEIALASERQAGERKSRFLSMISHEYRTPLAIIRTNIDLLECEENWHLSPLSIKTEKMKRAVKRLVEIMDISLQRSKLSDSHEKESFKNFRVAPMINEVIADFQTLWPEHSLFYSQTVDLLEIYGNYNYLETVLVNLLDNARKYSPTNSVIDVHCQRERAEVVIKIHNQCKDITSGEKSLLFEKYHRGSNSGDIAGTGVGLWQVRMIVDLHGGNVSIETSSGEFTVIVRLPLADMEPKKNE